MAPEKPEQHALVIIRGIPQVWSNHKDGWEAFLVSMGGKLIHVYSTREEAYEASGKMIDEIVKDSGLRVG
jgi:hypothetical protein